MTDTMIYLRPEWRDGRLSMVDQDGRKVAGVVSLDVAHRHDDATRYTLSGIVKQPPGDDTNRQWTGAEVASKIDAIVNDMSEPDYP